MIRQRARARERIKAVIRRSRLIHLDYDLVENVVHALTYANGFVPDPPDEGIPCKELGDHMQFQHALRRMREVYNNARPR